ncbi:hypothetical protein DCAR_0314121 [Daucus carota subsp. sativus]|uniref:Uncharacterized protein n=1 Tax=Daucus carota subsp. sativus TaxID=79200 RepID=A0AAF0WSY1_DAUCS|nr:hypothetical protein DCAR_0314121 [Daucus carota subsp. sativus]
MLILVYRETTINICRHSPVDAFTESAFKGNPAAVCLLEEEKGEKWLQLVATEFNLSETCFLTRIDLDSPNPSRLFIVYEDLLVFISMHDVCLQVKLCGHATLAASHFIFSSGLVKVNVIEFMTLSGVLTARRVSLPEVSVLSQLKSDGFCIELDFPVVPLVEYTSVEVSNISQSLNGASIVDIKKRTTEDDLLVMLSSGKTVAELQPMFEKIQKLPCRGMTVTALAPSESGFDIYSRFFLLGLDTIGNLFNACNFISGSCHRHCTLCLGTLWCQKLGKSDLVAYQASTRGGFIRFHLDERNQRVMLQGKAVTVMEGSLLV